MMYAYAYTRILLSERFLCISSRLARRQRHSHSHGVQHRNTHHTTAQRQNQHYSAAAAAPSCSENSALTGRWSEERMCRTQP